MANDVGPNHLTRMSRRHFLRRSAIVGGGVLLGGSSSLLAQSDTDNNRQQHAPAHGDAARDKEDTMRIRIIVKGTALSATLEDTPAARDFAALLPLTLTLQDYHATEKIADLPSRLSTDAAPEGIDPEVGDITYYAPWGNIALFYKDFGYAKGLIKLGSLDGGADVFNVPGAVGVTIEPLQE